MNPPPTPDTRPHGLLPLEIGSGRVDAATADVIRMAIPAKGRGYADAQLDDHRRLRRGRFPWMPPVRMQLRARASHPAPGGTLGFGFWNDPFTLSLGQAGAARRLPALPQAIWFFYGSPPNDLAFTPGIPGQGWRAASLRSTRLPALPLALAAPPAILLSRIPGLRGVILRAARRMIHAAEAMIPEPLDAWHEYALEWHPCEASFWVDGRLVLHAPDPPAGPLGFVAWIDNQYATASPESGLGFGVVPTDQAQWLEISDLSVVSL